MEASTSATIPSEEAIVFRPSKKRKVYRQRATSQSPPPEDISIHPAPAPSTSTGPQTLDELITSSTTDHTAQEELSVAAILRQRKQHRQRVGGVEFRAAPPTRANEETALAIREEEKDKIKDVDPVVQDAGTGSIIRQFSRQTGLVGDVDKHMMAYIDSELAKRRQTASMSTSTLTSQLPASFFTAGSTTTTAPDPALALPERQPAALGKLHEIDLGPSSRAQNVHRTLAALDPSPAPTTPVEKPPKPRIGRDGKPYIPRPRKRRGSDAVRRDALVEQVLSENRIEIYEAIPSSRGGAASGSGAAGAGPGGADEQADEALEEAFRQEFLDAVASRQRLKKPAQVSGGGGVKGKGGKEEEALKGPKLGGSRSARAAMRDKMLAEQKAGKR